MDTLNVNETQPGRLGSSSNLAEVLKSQKGMKSKMTMVGIRTLSVETVRVLLIIEGPAEHDPCRLAVWSTCGTEGICASSHQTSLLTTPVLSCY